VILTKFHLTKLKLEILKSEFKGRVQRFSMQVVMNRWFLLYPEIKNWRKSTLSFSRKMQKTHALLPKNDVTEPKARLL